MAYPNTKSGFTIRNRGRAAFSALWLAGKQFIAGCNFTIAQGATSNITLITITPCDKDGSQISHSDSKPVSYLVYLSDSASGLGITATTASGAVAAGSKGAVLATETASKALRVISDANGEFQLSITDTAKTLFYVCFVNPATGVVYTSRRLVTGDYK